MCTRINVCTFQRSENICGRKAQSLLYHGYAMSQSIQKPMSIAGNGCAPTGRARRMRRNETRQNSGPHRTGQTSRQSNGYMRNGCGKHRRPASCTMSITSFRCRGKWCAACTLPITCGSLHTERILEKAGNLRQGSLPSRCCETAIPTTKARSAARGRSQCVAE